MKTTLICFACSIGIIATVAAPTWGEPQSDETVGVVKSDVQGEDPQEAQGFSIMPAPLDGVTGNLLDLEKTGHLKVIKGTFGRTKMFDDRALLWTIEVVKPLTCGHAILLLQKISDIRFYRDDKAYHREKFATRLFYESWLDVDAVSHEILDRYERFDIWMDLTEAEAWMLTHNKTNRVIFSRPRQHRNIEAKRQKWK